MAIVLIVNTISVLLLECWKSDIVFLPTPLPLNLPKYSWTYDIVKSDMEKFNFIGADFTGWNCPSYILVLKDYVRKGSLCILVRAS